MYLRLKRYRRALGLEKVLKAAVSKRSAMLTSGNNDVQCK